MTINPEITNDFKNEIETFAKTLLFTIETGGKLPKHNTQDILKKYIQRSTIELKKHHVPHNRAKALSKQTLEDVLKEIM